MESKTNYFLVGVMVLLLAAGLLITSLWLSVGFDQKKYLTYTVYMREPISGLNDESPVKYNGVKVGYISQIELNNIDPQQVKLQIKVVAGTPITTSTQASLVAQGITGTTYLGLSANSSTFIPLQKTAGEPYPVIPYKPSFFYQLEKNIDDVTRDINRVFNRENAQLINQSLANIEKTSAVIEQNNANINKSLQELPVLIHALKDSVRQFNQTSHDISTAGVLVSDTMRAGRNSIDKISQQAIPPAVVLLRRLNLIAANLEQVSAEMRQNPAIIIRGSAPLKPGPGE
ncbi:MAG TPA: MCE family protein [Legionella sp.]|nr:MCE family protein [Legionella sp.]